MEQAVRADFIAAWRCLAMLLTYPSLIVPGTSAVILVISSGCVLLDSWSLEGAMSNLFLGLLAAAGLAGLWIATPLSASAIARNRSRFVLVTAGLLTGLILDSLISEPG